MAVGDLGPQWAVMAGPLQFVEVLQGISTWVWIMAVQGAVALVEPDSQALRWVVAVCWLWPR